MLKQKISFIGFGRMGGALAGGAIAAGAVRRAAVTAYDPDANARAAARRLRVRLAASEREAVLGADIVFLCVKPQQMTETLRRIAEIPEKDLRRRVFVSIAAGIPIARFEKALGRKTPVIRVMPNTPALLRAGVSAVSRGHAATSAHMRFVEVVLSAVGDCVSVPESAMDAVTALSGSGPAYAFYLAEAMAQAGAALGLPVVLAKRLARQTLFGSGLMLHERKDEPEELRRQVTSPGGTTAAAIAVFDAENLKARIAKALRAAARRSAQLSKA